MPPPSAAPTPALLPPIRRYLLQWIVGILLVSLAAFAAGAFLLLVKPAQDGIARVEMARAADQVEADIRALTNQIERMLATAHGWGRNGVIQIARPEDFARTMIPVLRTRPQLSAALLANERGEALFLGRDEGGGWLLRAIGTQGDRMRQQWRHLDADGRLLREETVVRDFDLRSRSWYQGALALAGDDGIHWTAPYPFFESREPGISTSMRWTEGNGEKTVLAFDVLLADLSRFTSQVTAGTSGRAAVLTADGRLLGLPRSEEAARAGFLKTPREAGLAELASAHAQWLQDGKPLAQAGFFASAGETWIGRFRPLPLQNQQFLIATFAPRADFTLGSAWDAAASLGLMAAVVVAAFLISHRFSRRFSAVVDSLVGESERIGRLQLDEPVRTRGRHPGNRPPGGCPGADAQDAGGGDA